MARKYNNGDWVQNLKGLKQKEYEENKKFAKISKYIKYETAI